MRQKPKIIVIAGPTASGKTNVAVKLARDFNGEIVSADSRQVFRGLDLGTGKDLSEFGDVKYHLIDVVNPGEKFTLFDYLPIARKAIDDILVRGKLPIVVGGTGLYIQGLVEGFELRQLEIKKEKLKIYSRKDLEEMTTGELVKVLEENNSQKTENIDLKNRHRLIRAIELVQEGLEPIKIKPRYDFLQIAIDCPRKELHDRIDKRVESRFNAGMLKEVEDLLNNGIDRNWLYSLGLEYKVITDYLVYKKYDSIDAMKQDLKYKIHQFARRQMTWFRRFSEINWLSDYKDIKRFVKIFISH